MNDRFSWVPLGLVAVRALLGPVLLWFIIAHHMGPWYFIGLTAALLSDIFDGMFARCIGASTEQLRLWDGWCDTWFYLLMSIGLWLHAGYAVAQLAGPLIVLAAAHIVLHSYCHWKYGRGPSYHGVSAKVRGLGLFITFVVAFATPLVVPALWISIVLGLINAVDELAMSVLLPRWHQDVLTRRNALELRRDDLAEPVGPCTA